MFRNTSTSAIETCLYLLLTALSAASLFAQESATPVTVKNIVLVHGAFADGSSWSKVIPLLQDMGYHVAAVQNPTTTLAGEVAFTKRVIALQDGPVILVGHSWGGAVITQAGDDPKVAGLVYVAAYAPDPGQSANDASSPYGWTPGQKQIKADPGGYALETPEGMIQDITEDLSPADQQLSLTRFVVERRQAADTGEI